MIICDCGRPDGCVHCNESYTLNGDPLAPAVAGVLTFGGGKAEKLRRRKLRRFSEVIAADLVAERVWRAAEGFEKST